MLSGERKFEEPTTGVDYYRVERVAGKFTRAFVLPQSIKREEIKVVIAMASFPKADEAKPKQIAVV